MTPPTQQDKPIDLEALRLAAEAAKDWHWETVQDDQFGHFSEGSFYDIGTVDVDQYGIHPGDEHNSVVLAYLAKAGPAAILALLALIDAQQKQIADLAK